MNAFSSLSKGDPVNRRMALLVALGVGTAGALALAYGLCRFYRNSGRSSDVVGRRNAEEKERRSIDSSQEDESVSEGELSGEESRAEKRKATKVQEEEAEDNVKSGQNPTNTQISPYEENAMVYEFGPLPEDKGTYIVSPKRTSTPTTNSTIKPDFPVASSEPVSGELHQSPIFVESTSESLKHDSQPGIQVKPDEPKKTPEPKKKPVDGKLKEIKSQEERSQLLSDETGDILGESNSSLKQHHGIPVKPAELKEKVAEREIKANGEEEKTHSDIPELPSDRDEISDQPSKSSEGVLKLQVEQSENESEKNNGEGSQSETSHTPLDTSGTSAQPKSPNYHHGIQVMSAELKEKVAKRKLEDSNNSENSVQSSSQASNGQLEKSTPPPVAPKPKPNSPELVQSPQLAQPTSESPNRLRGILVTPAGLAEKLSERKQKVHNGVENEEEASEPLPAARQEAAAHSEGVSLDDPVQVSPLHHLSRNKGPARRPPTRTPTHPVV